jgi:hypothetical protein
MTFITHRHSCTYIHQAHDVAGRWGSLYRAEGVAWRGMADCFWRPGIEPLDLSLSNQTFHIKANHAPSL